MPKAELTTFVTPKCRALAEKMNLELVDVCLEKEGAGKYLRIYLDKAEGLSMNDCEAYHRAIQPQLEAYDYDFLEVSSPGVDRPLKSEKDFERHTGDEVEVKLFKAVDGAKLFTGTLAGLDEEDNVLLDAGGVRRSFPKKTCAMVRPVVDMSGIESVDLSDDDAHTV